MVTRSNKVTRRALLSGAAAGAALATSQSASSMMIRHGGKQRPTSVAGGPLTVLLEFRDGKSMEFTQSAATDIGDYVGTFVRQKCLRQIADGYGDYRDAFLVDFRPDADGSRDEVVIEFGTLFNFPAGTGILNRPAAASGVAPLHLGFPPALTYTKLLTGGTHAQAGEMMLYHTYVTPAGETPATKAGYIPFKLGELFTITSPPPHMDATAYNVYAVWKLTSATPQATPGNVPVRQNSTPIPLGTDWAEPAEGVALTGPTLPAFVNFTIRRPTTIAYDATISGGSLTAPITVQVPVHYWRSRWRWYSAPRPMRRTVAQVVALKATLPVATVYAYSHAPPGVWTWAGPMDKGPIQGYMGTAGGRADIGFTTDWVAGYLATQSANSEITMRTSAEATGTWACWVRDASTGALVNTATVAKVPAFDDAFRGTANPQDIPDVLSQGELWSYIYGNSSHVPNLAFVPWMLTDDPYYLEGAHVAANFCILETNGKRNSLGVKVQTADLTPRGWAWSKRDVLQLAGFSPTVTPSWLLPRSYWTTVKDGNRAFAQRYLDNKDSAVYTVFGLIPNVVSWPAFQAEYIACVMAWAKWSGTCPEWDAIADYSTKIRIAMADPTNASGWDHRLQVWMYLPIYDANLGAGAGDIRRGDPLWGGTYSVNTPTSLAQLWVDYLAMVDGNAAFARGWPKNPDTWPADGLATRDGNLPHYRAALAACTLAGYPGARAGHDWLAAQLVKDHNYGGEWFNWAISPD